MNNQRILSLIDIFHFLTFSFFLPKLIITRLGLSFVETTIFNTLIRFFRHFDRNYDNWGYRTTKFCQGFTSLYWMITRSNHVTLTFNKNRLLSYWKMVNNISEHFLDKNLKLRKSRKDFIDRSAHKAFRPYGGSTHC